MCCQADLALHDRVDTVRSDDDIRTYSDAVGEGEPYTGVCFPDSRTLMSKANRVFRLRVIEHIQ
jgi:hypothetical protein